MRTGTVKWFNAGKGYGFISAEGGEDVFIHFSNIQKDGFKTLSANDVVEYELGRNDKGPQAINVRKV